MFKISHKFGMFYWITTICFGVHFYWDTICTAFVQY